ncbi:hypothetical protein J4573_25800 [Actinomadura barringtoniae]|uniref:Uncharacterized protein n=1 Tax=Actinomadura barringtoniae TaxID=1427535 RepID=A0A939PI71_9ACTN|nr:DUF5957 family protein [Actinomadura barringtoniae]MBO2450543.1 hypothetical protein [Actinomadura barringtoniae]
MKTIGSILLGFIAGLLGGFFLEVVGGAVGHFLLGGTNMLRLVALFPPLLAIAGAIAGPYVVKRANNG